MMIVADMLKRGGNPMLVGIPVRGVVVHRNEQVGLDNMDSPHVQGSLAHNMGIEVGANIHARVSHDSFHMHTRAVVEDALCHKEIVRFEEKALSVGTEESASIEGLRKVCQDPVEDHLFRTLFPLDLFRRDDVPVPVPVRARVWVSGRSNRGDFFRAPCVVRPYDAARFGNPGAEATLKHVESRAQMDVL